MTFSNLAQRVTFSRNGPNFIEKKLKEDEPFLNGVLWCIAKVWLGS